MATHLHARSRLTFLWLGILLVTATAVLLQQLRPEPDGAAADDAEVDVASIDMQGEMMGKLTVAAKSFAPTLHSSQLLSNASPLEEGTVTDQLAYAVLVGAVEDWNVGAERARDIVLDETAADAISARVLREDVVAALEERASGTAGSVSDETLARIESKLGFFARLLGTDATDEATALLAVVVVIGLWYFTVFVCGIIALVVLGAFALHGKVIPRFEPAPTTNASLVLGETFLLWITAFLACTVGAAVLSETFGEAIGSTGSLSLSILAMALSLVVLAYPLRRGLAFSELQRLIGLHKGDGVIKESLYGIVCYLSAVPILVVGLVIFWVLTMLSEFLFGKPPTPSHPAVEMLRGAGTMEVVLLFVLASVTAPIVEEIGFRGMLYGHLRSITTPQIRLASMLVAALVSSFIFAVIHPQGVLFVPALGGLAVGFCLYREVRGSLIAPMVAHGINNAVTLALGVTLMS